MTSETLPPAAAGGQGTASRSVALIARWMIGVRLVAVSALLIGALLVQATTEELLPIGRFARLAGLVYGLSLLWLLLLSLRTPPRLHAGLQLAGDLLTIAALTYLTGGLWSPFPFLFLIPVAVAAFTFGLRGSLTVAGGAFVLYAVLAEAMAFHLLPPPSIIPIQTTLSTSALPFQLLVTGVGFALVALLTSLLAHSRQQAEVSLRDERATTARFLALSANVLKSVESGVLAADAEGTVVLANPAAEAILQSQAPLEGRSLAELLAFEGSSWDEVLPQLASRAPLRLEATLPAVGVPVGCTVTPLRGEGTEALGVVVHFRDLTKVRQAARRARLRERLAAVGEMAAGIAHEIRNPLASISGSAQVLGSFPGLPENQRKLLRIMVEESNRLSGIVESFLDYARPPDPQRGPCDIARTLEETLTLFSNSRELSPEHHIETEIVPHEEPVVADEKQLRQAFFNLARNAIQAMPRGGTMRVGSRPEGANYVIRFSDEGIGMEPQQIQEISQPFRAFRVGGTGLGLAVVYSIVSDHGGEVEVESEPARGSTFILRLPMAEA